MDSDDLLIAAAAVAGLVLFMGILVTHEQLFDPVVRLVDTAILKKSTSGSGLERAYWNAKSLVAVVQTSGAGVGMGSSRASSWPIAVISQLGLVGSLLMGTLVLVVVRGLGGLASHVDSETSALVASARASAIAGLVGGSIAGGAADPGMHFFIVFAIVAATRARAKTRLTSRSTGPSWPNASSLEPRQFARKGTGPLAPA
jgi:hypothetical protein